MTPGFSVESVLVVRLSSLGDVVLAMPAVEALKTAWPSARLTFLTKRSFVPLLNHVPFIDEAAVFEDRGGWGWAGEIRRRRFSLVVDLHGTLRSRWWSMWSGAPHRVRYDKRAMERRWLVRSKRTSPRLLGTVVDRYLEPLEKIGIAAARRVPRLYLGPQESLSPEWENRLGRGPWVAVAPGAAHETKRWPAERFASAASRVAKGLGAGVVVVGTPSDAAVSADVCRSLTVPGIDLSGRTGVRDLMLVLHRSAVLLSNDSGAAHVGAALGVPTVAVFGPTVRAFGFFPAGPATAVVEAGGVSCRPCSLHGSDRCPLGHFRCMEDVTVDRVIEAVEGLLSSQRRGRAPA